MTDIIDLGARPLNLEDVALVAAGKPVKLSALAREKVLAARKLVEQCTTKEEPVYGITTGFGGLAEVKIAPDKVKTLQKNLILSHAAGVGRPMSRSETRAMMLLRAQTLAEGHSGVRPEVIELVLEMLNRGVHPVVPEKGSVGASGDLAPLAHLALGMLGQGSAEYEGQTIPAMEALSRASLKPLDPEAKEGLSLVNGTQGMAALGSLAILAAESLAQLADIAAALTLEGLYGIMEPFDPRIQGVRPHPGQRDVAQNIRTLLQGSPLEHQRNSTRVQDPYSLRCTPQVHGASRDTFKFAHGIFHREINSATDNPLVFAEDGDILSGGNFHGQPLALALDFVAIAVAELGNIAERRVEQLVNPALSGLPPFLVEEGGTNSGYMMAQVTAASLVNENKAYATPASIDSIPGSASREDHVSMGMTSARKLREIVANTQAILSVELLCGAQAIDLRGPESLGKGTAEAHRVIREAVPMLKQDRFLSRDIEGVLSLVRRNVILEAVSGVVGKIL